MPFIGKNPTAGFATIVKDDFTPNGTDTTFTLSKQVASTTDIAVFVGNVRQEPTTAYTVNGTTLDFGSGNAPANGLDMYVLHIGGTQEVSTIPADGTISSAKLQSNLSLSGDLTVDTNTLKVDATNNKVGIGLPSHTSMEASLDVLGNSDTTAALKLNGGNDNHGFHFYTSSTNGDLVIKREASGIQSESFRIDRSAGSILTAEQPMFIANDIRNGVNMTSEAHLNISRHFTAQTGANRGNCFASVGETNPGRFTAPVDGLYLFGWNLFTVGYDAGSASSRVGINKNGTTEWSGGDRIGHANQGSCLVNLAANDYVTLGSQGGTYTIYWYSADQHSRFWGYLVG